MKTHDILFLAALALLSCNRMEVDCVTEEPAHYTLTAEILPDPDTKTSLSGAGKVLWTSGDAIGVFVDGTSSPVLFSLSGGAGATNASFSGSVSGSSYVAVYPYKMAGTASGSTVSLTLPSEQHYSAASFGNGDNPMYATGSSGALSFRNICSLVKLSITGHHTVTSIVFESNNAAVKVSGPATVSAGSGGIPKLTMGAAASTSVTLTTDGVMLNDVTPTDFYLVLPPQTYTGGFTVTVNTSTGSMVKALNTDFTLERARIHAAGTFAVQLDSGIEPSTFLQGSGTQASPFLVSSLEDLLLVQGAVNAVGGTISPASGSAVAAATAFYRLTGNLDLSPVCGESSGQNWTPMGSEENPFQGSFDGGGHTISNLYIHDTDATAQGLFGYIDGSVNGCNYSSEGIPSVCNLVVSGNVTAKQKVGLIAGSAEDFAFLQNCVVSGAVTAVNGGYAGGLMGDGSYFTGCTNLAVVSGSGNYTGGITGVSSRTVKDCINKGTVSNTGQYTGGIQGYQNAGKMFNCSNEGSVSGVVPVGGIAGYSRQGAQLVNCINYGSVYASYGYVGGICGHCDAYSSSNFNTAIYNCVNVGAVSVSSSGYYADKIGGVCGDNNSTIKQSYWLYDPGSGEGLEAGIGVNEAVAENNYGLTRVQMAGTEPASLTLYTAGNGNAYSNLIKALNAWAYDNATSSLDYSGWTVSSGYPAFTGSAPELPEADEAQDYFDISPASVNVDGTGGSFTVTVTANVSFEVSGKPDWVTESGVTHPSDNSWEYSYTVPVNPEPTERSGVISFCDVRGVCTPVTVVQEAGPDYYISTDYTADGTVTTLQTASEGNGIDMVLMGDGYSDRQIADGTYLSVMNKMADAFFGVEPYASYRHLFNVYVVYVVSQTEGYEHDGQALESYFGEGTLVGGDDTKCIKYAQNAISQSRISNSLIVVAMNSDAYAGTCWMYYSSSMQGDYGNGMSVSYFPTGANDEALARVMHHEAGGHGFSKLGDEYAYQSQGAIPQSEIDNCNQLAAYGWWKNIDFTDDPATVKWNHFLSDERYQYDGLGCFEGGYTYWSGVWRPTENSIMRFNTGGFNAPSREAIWYRMHKLAYGSSWTYDFEAFVAYDAINRNTSAGAPSAGPRNYVERILPPLHPPVVVRLD